MIRKKFKTLFVSTLLMTTSVLASTAAFANTGLYYLDHTDLPLMPEQLTLEDYSEEFAQEDTMITYVTTSRVHLRTGASTDFESLRIIASGETVQALYYDAEGWSEVIYGGEIGYIKSEFLGVSHGDAQAGQTSTSSVELATWSEVKNVFTIGVPAAVFDVYSGRTYYVKSFSNGKHADVEPVTAQDTAIMKETFNGVWSWDVRPVWVTINGRTFAGSINGMPHGGGVNPDNNMNGQVCIHFLESSTHNGNSSYTRLHQNVLKTAFNMAQ